MARRTPSRRRPHRFEMDWDLALTIGQELADRDAGFLAIGWKRARRVRVTLTAAALFNVCFVWTRGGQGAREKHCITIKGIRLDQDAAATGAT